MLFGVPVRESFDVDTVMDIIYGESSEPNYSAFVFGWEGKKAVYPGEIIRPDGERDYTTFWRRKPQ